MNPTFDIIEYNGFQLLVYRPWWEEGIVHGMTLRPPSFGGDSLLAIAPEFCGAMGVLMMANPRQTHSDLFFDARSVEETLSQVSPERKLLRFGEYDAVIAPCSQNLPEERVGYAIATADCVPIVLRGSSGWGLIHAGWRGLANGIIGKVARALGESVEAAIFACAGGDVYEVGSEVIEAIGSAASYRPGRDGRYLLDTAQTASQQLREFMPAQAVEISGVCTIRDSRFHSHRRDGECAGRAITFVAPPASSS
jgi:copper oxidase (laccase) domain-containing protein